MAQKTVKVIRMSDEKPEEKEILKRELNVYLGKGYKIVTTKTSNSKATVVKPETKTDKK